MKQKPTKKCENGVQLRPASIEGAFSIQNWTRNRMKLWAQLVTSAWTLVLVAGNFGIPGGLTTRIDSILWNSRKNSKLSLTPYEQTGR